MAFSRTNRRNKIRRRIRGAVSGTASRPRLSIYRSNKGIYAQIINDVEGVTIAAASSKDVDAKLTKSEQAKEVGKVIASRASEKGIDKVAFDRGGYLYHGRVSSLAEGAREGGLNF
jgi:large subunit ribosomal protein L18